MSDLATSARTLRSLHRTRAPLVLVNAWDAASAARVEAAGGRAIGTSSAAISESLGEPDGPTASVDALFAVIRRIATAVTVPVTADLLDGYGLEAGELVERLLDAGAVGLNVEDSDHATPGTLVAAGRAAERIAEVRAAARARGVDIVINARVDAYLHQGPGATDEVVARSVRYLAAGADCVYPIRLADPAVVRTVVDVVGGPVNANLGGGTVAALAAAGAHRISVGPMPFRTAYAALDQLAADLLGPGS